VVTQTPHFLQMAHRSPPNPAFELGSLPLFDGIDPAALALMAERAIPRRASGGSVLWSQGTRSRGLFVLLSGTVRAVRVREDGRETVLHRSGPGSTLGEIPLFDAGPYPATLVADGEVVLLVIDRPTLEAAMERDVQLAWRFLRALSSRVRELAGRLDSASTDTVMIRLARHLSTCITREGATGFGLGATQAALARDLGTVREVVARRLTHLVATGVLRRAGRARYDLVDPVELRRLGG